MDERNPHRVVVWAAGPNGIPVTCACGWKVYRATKTAAYKAKHDHEARS